MHRSLGLGDCYHGYKFIRFSDSDLHRKVVLDILRKTWPKMSPRAQAIAVELPLSPKAKEYVAAALG